MAWIELHQTLWAHRKTLIMSAIMGLPPVYTAAHMAHLWCWALDNAPDGDLTGLPNQVIAAGAGWTGAPDTFVDAAVTAGFFDRDGDGLRLHDWEDYAGRLIEQRAFATEQKRRHRELYNNKSLVQAIRKRDRDRCRYCGRIVNWRDRKGPDGATYDYVDPDGPTSLENIVVACRACNSGKNHRTPEAARYTLLPPPLHDNQVGNLRKSTDIQSQPDPASRQTVPNRTVQYPTSTIEADSQVDSKSVGWEGGTGGTNQPASPPDITLAERAILAELKAVPQYPFDYAKDLEHIRDLATTFPEVDLLREVKKWRAYKRDKPLQAKSNPRLQLRNWCEIAHKRLLGEQMARDRPHDTFRNGGSRLGDDVQPGHAPPEVKAYIESSLAAFAARKEALSGGSGGPG